MREQQRIMPKVASRKLRSGLNAVTDQLLRFIVQRPQGKLSR
jgi:hypothetical protein